MGAAKRFYKVVAVEAGPGGHRITLDGRPVRTPAGTVLALTSRDLASAVADEWSAQEKTIRPDTMPLFRLCATAVDRVGPDRQAVIEGIVAYAPTDLLCYRAVEPDDLVERQARTWQPLVDWAEGAFGIEFRVTTGVVPVAPAAGLQETLAVQIGRLDDLALAALASATATCGSVILGLALVAGRIDAEAAFAAAHLDELYQAEKWGEDEEAAARRQSLRQQTEAAVALVELAGTRAWECVATFGG